MRANEVSALNNTYLYTSGSRRSPTRKRKRTSRICVSNGKSGASCVAAGSAVLNSQQADTLQASTKTPDRTEATEAGITILELIVVFAMIALLFGIAAPNLAELDRPLEDGSAALRGFVKQTRAKAIASTSAYTITPTSASRIETQVSTTCGGTQTAEPKLFLELPKGVGMLSTSWSLCFSSRGFANNNVQVTLQDDELSTKVIEVFLGGAVELR